jgi:hypothetical protein
MISVGVDVKRLGLMVVAGQPKTPPSTSRRPAASDARSPGLVLHDLQLGAPARPVALRALRALPRDLLQHVEALSVTPFSPRALDRGLTALFVSLGAKAR